MPTMNWLMVAAAALMFGAAVWEGWSLRWNMAGLYLCYGTANAILARI